jgi:hypothetical protein
MLFGGRPLPERPLWVRALTVAIFLAILIPFAKNAVGVLPAFGIGAPRKLSAADTAEALKSRLFGPPYDPRRDLRCEEHSKTSDATPERIGAWDYICTFGLQPISSKRMKVGVRVTDKGIETISQRYELTEPYVK